MTEQTETKPTIRVRIQHSHTLKDLWRLSETTVEYTGQTVDWDLISREMTKAHHEGLLEAKHRNQVEATT